MWINKKHKQRINVRLVNEVPNLADAQVVHTWYDRQMKIKMMVLFSHEKFWVLSLMFDGEIEQGELLPVTSLENGVKVIDSFKGFIYGQTSH
jgi:hypothetical protein